MSQQFPVDPQQPGTPQPPARYQAAPSGSDDDANLRTLSTCWYVFSVLVALPSCLGGAYMLFGIVFGLLGATAGAASNDAGGAGAGMAFGAIGLIPCCFGGGIAAFFLTVSLLSFRCARNLIARRSHMQCLVTAIIACIFMPLGTILGIFTLMVLNRATVKPMFS
jgi:hypothetical protein